MEISKSPFVYEFSYPHGMELAGIVFYVGKGTDASRMDAHFKEASRGCECDKCNAIRSVWDAGLSVVRRIVFESLVESKLLEEERRRILLHQSPHLTNVQNSPVALEKRGMTLRPRKEGSEEEDAGEAFEKPKRTVEDIVWQELEVDGYKQRALTRQDAALWVGRTPARLDTILKETFPDIGRYQVGPQRIKYFLEKDLERVKTYLNQVRPARRASA